jgi:23S rRNA (uracil1939-C5)-methyltransferase
MSHLPIALTHSGREPDPSPLRVQAPRYGGAFTTQTPTNLDYVLPHELVQLTPTLHILEASAARTQPACSHFGTCGGCHYQHALYPEQLLLKRQILTQLLTEANLPIPAIHTESAQPYGYRNRIRLRIQPESNGRFRAGYSLRGTNQFLPIAMCPIAAPALWTAAETILTLAATDPLLERWLSATSELELFTTPDESQLQLHFFLRTAQAGNRESSSFPGLCTRISQLWARSGQPVQLVGASATLDPELNRRSRRAWSGTTWGADGIAYPAARRTYWLPRGAFFQVNRLLIDRLVALVRDPAGSSVPHAPQSHRDAGVTSPAKSLAWDLFAGVGLFTRALAERFDHVIAVEGAEPAATALATLKSPVTAVHSSTLDFLRVRVLDRERPSLIVLDPPRAGLGSEAAQLLARVAAPEVIYVSCDPTTLALDLQHLIPTYEIATLTLIDLFPQTFHIETVTHLRRKPQAVSG